MRMFRAMNLILKVTKAVHLKMVEKGLTTQADELEEAIGILREFARGFLPGRITE